MSDTYTFVTKDQTIKITVKKEFLDVCPNPEDQSIQDLTTKFKFFNYLHNPFGPAMQFLAPGKEKAQVFIVDGTFFPPDTLKGKEEIDKIKKAGEVLNEKKT